MRARRFRIPDPDRNGDTRADMGELRGEVRAMRWTVSLVGMGIALLMLALRLLGGS